MYHCKRYDLNVGMESVCDNREEMKKLMFMTVIPYRRSAFLLRSLYCKGFLLREIGQIFLKRRMRLLLLLLFAQPSLFIPLPGNPQPPPDPPQSLTIQQSPGQPLPPGTVTYRNTWNQSQSPRCAYPQLPKEPL